MKKITVATYNICGCRNFADYKTTKTESGPNPLKTAKAIDKINADYLGLNEVFCEGKDEGFNRQIPRLATFCEYPYSFYAKGRTWNDIGTIGNGVLSRFPITEIKTFPIDTIPESERDIKTWYEERVIIKATVDVGGKAVDFIDTHFGLHPKETENMLDKLLPTIDSCVNPVVLMGDFNFQPNDEILKPLFDRLISVQKAVKNTEYTWATYDPQMTIDYIFVSKDIKIESFEVVKIYDSDHFPLKAELILP